MLSSYILLNFTIFFPGKLFAGSAFCHFFNRSCESHKMFKSSGNQSLSVNIFNLLFCEKYLIATLRVRKISTYLVLQYS